MSSTRISRHVNAPREAVYRALLDSCVVSKWKVPTGMTCHVHAFDPREGGPFRISHTYEAPTATGKTTPHTDTYHGRFVKLVPSAAVRLEIIQATFPVSPQGRRAYSRRNTFLPRTAPPFGNQPFAYVATRARGAPPLWRVPELPHWLYL